MALNPLRQSFLEEESSFLKGDTAKGWGFDAFPQSHIAKTRDLTQEDSSRSLMFAAGTDAHTSSLTIGRGSFFMARAYTHQSVYKLHMCLKCLMIAYSLNTINIYI